MAARLYSAPADRGPLREFEGKDQTASAAAEIARAINALINLLLAVFVFLRVASRMLVCCLFLVSPHTMARTNRTIVSFPSMADGGLGDRFGQALQLATIAKLRHLRIVIKWNTGGRGREYPANIHEYVRFPPSLRFVDAIPPELTPIRNAGPGYREGFDHIPETSHRMLLGASIIDSSMQKYMDAFRSASGHFRFRKLRLLPPQPYVAVHLRRGDRGGGADVPLDLRRYLTRGKYVVVSDSPDARRSLCALVECVEMPSVLRHEVALRDFFTLARARYIIQSVKQRGELGGWSSFSYMASAIGQVPLVACVPPHTRLELARTYCQCNLSRVVPC